MLKLLSFFDPYYASVMKLASVAVFTVLTWGKVIGGGFLA